MAVEAFTNDGLGTVTVGGTTAPAPGTVEAWTVNVVNQFPAASAVATPPTSFYVCDEAPATETEKILVTVCPGSGPGSQSWTVTRGADGTTPVNHTSGFTVVQIVGRASLQAFQTPNWFNVYSQFGADPTGISDSTAAVLAALNAVPAAGGVVYFPPGKFRINTGGTLVNNVTPTYIKGAGRWATTIDFHGTGDCLRMLNPVYGGNGLWGGGVSDLTILGTSAGTNATGLHIGDGEQYELNVAVHDFSASGSIGVNLDNTVWWTEKTHGTIFARNCATHVQYNVATGGSTTVAAGSNGGTISGIASWASPSAGVLAVASTTGFPTSGTLGVAASGATIAVVTYTGTTPTTFTGCVYSTGSPSGTVATGNTVTGSSTNSFGYGDITHYLYTQPGQQGIVIQNGARPYHGRWIFKGNVAGQSGGSPVPFMTLTGSVPAGHQAAGFASQINDSEFVIQVETSTATVPAQTILFGSASNVITGYYGEISFFGTWTASNLPLPTTAPWLAATTGGSGTALVNGTPTILSWTAPNDGQLHRFMLDATLVVGGTNETGGAVGLSYTAPGGAAQTPNVFAANLLASSTTNGSTTFRNIAPNTTVSLVQTSALTAGGPATVYAEIWAS